MGGWQQLPGANASALSVRTEAGADTGAAKTGQGSRVEEEEQKK